MSEELKKLPQIGKLLEAKRFEGLNTESVKKIAKSLLDEIREGATSLDAGDIESEIIKRYEELVKPTFRPLINATGVVIHTNLGRAPISKKALEYASLCSAGYSNLEYDARLGKRGDRYGHLTKLAKFLFGCEDILLVNNNAAAVFLVLNTFSKNRECVVSRGELVEIGGGFRIPEVMANSGAKLKEVGATNKTRLADYENAISEKTRVLMKVHRSNFTINGFVEEVAFEDIAGLAKDKGLIDYYDLGSANLTKSKMEFANKEADIYEILKSSPSIVSFSADKLFGATQAGIILGKKALIDKLKKNQLLRMLRCDKLTLAIVEQTMLEYAFGDKRNIPAIGMLSMSEVELTQKAFDMMEKLDDKSKFEIIKVAAYVGGGSLPEEKIGSVAIRIISREKPQKLIKALREGGVIARVENESVLLDVRTIMEDDIESVTRLLNGLAL